ncbi:dipeptide epimerase [Marinilongibacter aquaticus]|uniref:dipeptide epimerase n=1 Tax=Marinilongibacter aquaticus TaxID=2975157 RepID=UPI0021BD9618|nr:dipeptide epimerase [Marinilongibacter aquaticus]UBM57611.1 dipeptide epimerase [Marinilongibacter aquaticus]
MSSELIHFKVRNKKVFKIAHGARTHTDTLLLKLEKDGIVAYGEAAHVPYYGIDIKDSIADIAKHWGEIYPLVGKDAAVFWDKVRDLLGENHFAICALDMAHQDWLSKSKGVDLRAHLGIAKEMQTPKSSYTIGIDEVEKMKQSVDEIDFPFLKIKLGSENDAEILKALREHSDKPMRVDVNAGWQLAQAKEMLQLMHTLGNFELLEQAFPIREIEGNLQLKEMNLLPVFVDESCVSKEDVRRVAPYVDGINIKLTKCGGPTPAMEMIKTCRELGLKIMLGCMMESSIGISTLAQLACLVDFVDMDGSSMIANDPADGVKIVKGEAVFNDRLGHGAVLKDDIDYERKVTLR